MNTWKKQQATAGANNNAGSSTRRDFMDWVGHGIGGAALLALLDQDQVLARGTPAEASVPWPHHPAKAKRVIHINLFGGLSQIDTYDYKPELEKHHGKKYGGIESADVFFGQIGLLRQSDWAFKQRGQSGLWISELFPHLGQVADELTIIRSMYAETSNHTPATFQENSGFRLNGFPTAGAWVSYGMGADTEDLPAYVVIPDTRGLPAGGSINWTNGFLPARHQGVILRSQGKAVDDLVPAREIAAATDVASRELLQRLNEQHLERHGAEDAFSARIRSYELAARMQLAVPEVTHLDGETQATHQLYGLDQAQTRDFGRSCLLARRLLEQGVRFVQLYSGGAFGSPRINWDGHEDMKLNHGQEAGRIDLPLAGLIRDLRQRGMLEDTLLLFTSEFGRTPFTQSGSDVLGIGRDHNQYGFSVWLAGAGLQPGIAYGSTDDIGWKAVENRTHWHDFHATVLHLLGIDHTKLTFYHNGIQRRLTNVHGELIQGILA